MVKTNSKLATQEVLENNSESRSHTSQ